MSTNNEETEHWNRCLGKVGASRDRAAFADLVRHFAPLLKAYMLKADGITADDAEKLVEETLLGVWQKAPGFMASQASASSLIYTIARNIRLDWQRQQINGVSLSVDSEQIYNLKPRPSSPELPVPIILGSKQQIWQWLATLPADQSAVLHKMFIEGKSIQEAAAALDLPLDRVTTSIRLALQNLKLDTPSDRQESADNH